MSGDDWCTIESDPGVFTELMEEIGVRGVELTELWSLDEESLSALQESGPIYGFIFLFKWQPGQDTSVMGRTPLSADECPSNLFFARQMTTNACATQAILSVILNAAASSSSSSSSATAPESTDKETSSSSSDENKTKSSSSSSSGGGVGGAGGDGGGDDGIDLGPILTEFKSFTSSFPPDLKGEAIGSSDELKKAHNGFARKDSFLSEGRRIAPPTVDDELFHFVAYVPFVPHDDNHNPDEDDDNHNKTAAGGGGGGEEAERRHRRRRQVVVYELDGLQSGPILVGKVDDNDDDDDHGDDNKETTPASSSSSWIALAQEAIQQRMEASQHVKFNLMAVVQDKRIGLEQKLEALQRHSDHNERGGGAGVGAGGADGHDHDMMNELRSALAVEQAKRHQWTLENQRRKHNYVPLCVQLLKELARANTLPTLVSQAQERAIAKRAKAMTDAMKAMGGGGGGT